ncbi:glycosyltransferase [Candidatus Nomurabacteria bacterium]|nr:glycosyltransferase [Candidatus Nomurabacteria bacterium]
MRIGLFSDTYLPTTNGISYVLQIMQANLEELGHEVYIFAPATNLRGDEPDDNDHIFRFPAIEGIFFDEQLTSVFFPSRVMKKIKKLDLDVIHFFTPSQIGLMGAAAAIRLDIPLVSQYSTDLYHYVEQYPNVLPGTIALSLIAPFVFKMTPRETIKMMRVFKPEKTITAWHKSMVARMHVMLHNNCDAVIALSRKMQHQLDSWGSTTATTLLPTGVDPIPSVSVKEIQDFKNRFGINKTDKILLYVGRLSREKNLDLLVDAFEKVAIKNPNTKLMFVGDFDYRKNLEDRSKELGISDRVIFPGRIPRLKLGVAYGSASIFLFPSTTDTQGLVVHEAAGAGLPLILCDQEVSEVFIKDETGLLSSEDSEDMATQIQKLLDDEELSKKLGKAAQKRAAQFSEIGQMEQLEKLYKKIIDEHKKVRFAGIDW